MAANKIIRLDALSQVSVSHKYPGILAREFAVFFLLLSLTNRIGRLVSINLSGSVVVLISKAYRCKLYTNQTEFLFSDCNLKELSVATLSQYVTIGTQYFSISVSI